MFVQLIEGRTQDRDSLQRQLDAWDRDVKPGAVGYLGGTGGIADDGTFFMAARFESAEAAKSNSDRPEQDAWWSETEKFLEGVTFFDASDIELWGRGGSEDAGFVQVMHGRTTDPARMRELDKSFESSMEKMRPDIIGGVSIDRGNGEFTSIAYFTTEEEARAGESQEMPPELADTFSEWQSLMGDRRFIDLTDPILSRP
ncbi:MAG: hypothetical protein WEA10_00055 [Actinomycetota bacterium]